MIEKLLPAAMATKKVSKSKARLLEIASILESGKLAAAEKKKLKEEKKKLKAERKARKAAKKASKAVVEVAPANGAEKKRKREGDAAEEPSNGKKARKTNEASTAAAQVTPAPGDSKPATAMFTADEGDELLSVEEFRKKHKMEIRGSYVPLVEMH